MRFKEQRPMMVFCRALLFAGIATSVMAQKYTLIDVPGSSDTHPVSINNRGDIVGYFCPAAGLCYARGFVRDFKGNVTVFEGIPTSINDGGTITGYIPDSTGAHFSFLRDQEGVVTLFNTPEPDPYPGVRNIPMAINNDGDVAGFHVLCGLCDSYLGFVREPNGKFC